MVQLSLLVLGYSPAYAQQSAGPGPAVGVTPSSLAVSLYKTSHLVFPFAVKSVDRGSGEILVEQDAALGNVLRVKAGKPGFRETNLTVITADGGLYSFLVTYAADPAVLTLLLPEATPPGSVPALVGETGCNEASAQRDAARVAADKTPLPGRRDNKFGMQLALRGIYVRGETMYYRLRLRNNSDIPYAADGLRFLIRDKQHTRRTATQEQELQPCYVYGGPASVAAQSERDLVVALPKVTLPATKYLAIRLMEKNGGRHLQLKVPYHMLLRAKPFSLPKGADDRIVSF